MKPHITLRTTPLAVIIITGIMGIMTVLMTPILIPHSAASEIVAKQQMRPGGSKNLSQDPYEVIVQRTQTKNPIISTLRLPVSEMEGVLITTYRIPYTSLPFIRYRSDANPTDAGSGSGNINPNTRPDSLQSKNSELYRSLPSIEVDLFEGFYKDGKRDKPEIGGRSVLRETIRDTVLATSYEETRNSNSDLQGAVVSKLPAGEYHAEIRTGQAGSDKKVTLPLRNISLYGSAPENQSKETFKPEIFLLQDVIQADGGQRLNLLNYGSSILYRESLVLGVMVPGSMNPEDLLLEITTSGKKTESERSDKALTRPEKSGLTGETDRSGDVRTPLFQAALREFTPYHLAFHEVITEKEQLALMMKNDAGRPESWVFVEVPANEFPNTALQITLNSTKNDSEKDIKPVHTRQIQSLWKDMPLSLYNLDLSIDMLRFILPQDQLKKMKDGDFAEKEKRFRTFWKEKDPTAGTEYNELMTEYYRRIDQAYETFTTFDEKGYNSDRGRTWILMGPPDSTERIYPTNSPTREIWTYPGKQYIFEATSGFGDFKLLTSESP